MPQISWENAISSLLDRFPELAGPYQEANAWRGNEPPGAHIVYEEVLSPFAGSIEAQCPPVRNRILAFFEDLAASPDDRVRELFGVTVLPNLLNEPDVYRRFARGFGPATRRLARSILKNDD